MIYTRKCGKREQRSVHPFITWEPGAGQGSTGVRVARQRRIGIHRKTRESSKAYERAGIVVVIVVAVVVVVVDTIADLPLHHLMLFSLLLILFCQLFSRFYLLLL